MAVGSVSPLVVAGADASPRYARAVSPGPGPHSRRRGPTRGPLAASLGAPLPRMSTSGRLLLVTDGSVGPRPLSSWALPTPTADRQGQRKSHRTAGGMVTGRRGRRPRSGSYVERRGRDCAVCSASRRGRRGMGRESCGATRRIRGRSWSRGPYMTGHIRVCSVVRTYTRLRRPRPLSGRRRDGAQSRRGENVCPAQTRPLYCGTST